MIFYRDYSEMLEVLSQFDKIITRCSPCAATPAERDFVKNARAATHDLFDAIKELDK